MTIGDFFKHGVYSTKNIEIRNDHEVTLCYVPWSCLDDIPVHLFFMNYDGLMICENELVIYVK